MVTPSDQEEPSGHGFSTNQIYSYGFEGRGFGGGISSEWGDGYTQDLISEDAAFDRAYGYGDFDGNGFGSGFQEKSD